MKKHSLLLLAGGMLAFAACNSGTQGNGASQATIDSMVNVRVMELQTQMQAKNDSIINALATVKADSIVAAMKDGSSTPAHSTARKTHTEAPKQTETPKTAQDNKFDRMKGNNTNTQNAMTKEQQKAQDDKFNRMKGK